VDLYLSCFGPALEEFSLHWPIKRGQPKPIEQKTKKRGRAQLDPLTEWFVLAWDAFEAPQFSFDEALRLARVVGLDLDKDVVGVLAEKKASDLILWDSSTRATKGKLGAPDGTKSWIDAIHHCAHRARSIDLNVAKQLLDDNGLANSPIFLTALEAVLEVLPLSARYTGFDPVKAAQPAASDFEALENLRRLALAEQEPALKQLELVLAELWWLDDSVGSDVPTPSDWPRAGPFPGSRPSSGWRSAGCANWRLSSAWKISRSRRATAPNCCAATVLASTASASTTSSASVFFGAAAARKTLRSLTITEPSR
jgi:hypothetical protein